MLLIKICSADKKHVLNSVNKTIAGVPRVRADGRRAGDEVVPVPRVDAVRPDHSQVQLVVLRRLPQHAPPLRHQHPRLQELPAHEGAYLLLFLQEGRRR
jgi:hypothetical protein